MSLERAYKNCRICYAELQKNGVETLRRNKEDLMGAFAYSNLAERAMNEAMSALEEERMYSTRYATGERTKRYKIAEDALQACVGCNFKSAGIAEFLRQALPDQFEKPSKEELGEKK